MTLLTASPTIVPSFPFDATSARRTRTEELEEAAAVFSASCAASRTTPARRGPRSRSRGLPYYAVTCNLDPTVVRTLLSLGCHFDCASQAEIALIQCLAVALVPVGVALPDIVYTNPTKARGHVDRVPRRANDAKVRKCAMVKVQLIPRIITDDSGSQCRLLSKFGVPPSHWLALLGEARRCGLEVVGVSFHVGSGCWDASRCVLALRGCKRLFEMAERDFG